MGGDQPGWQRIEVRTRRRQEESHARPPGDPERAGHRRLACRVRLGPADRTDRRLARRSRAGGCAGSAAEGRRDPGRCGPQGRRGLGKGLRAAPEQQRSRAAPRPAQRSGSAARVRRAQRRPGGCHGGRGERRQGHTARFRRLAQRQERVLDGGEVGWLSSAGRAGRVQERYRDRSRGREQALRGNAVGARATPGRQGDRSARCSW
mmetsp:Transcript_54294/g.151110  ORF Transcript_54294/g.151110 Transcript_54294/m.151110 type:complete len:206 (-) Transcript_54294:1108-1725(-)